MKKKPIPSNDSQRIDDDTWYYESRGSIHVIKWIGEVGTPSRKAVDIKIPWRTLMKSAERCRPEQVKPRST